IEQALLIIDKNIVKTIDGEFIEIRAHTLCIHSDTPGAINIARVVYEKLRENGIELKPMRVFIK
ncbi:MAG: LamB/YcsF family protein, partial [Desulfurococcaceae archaeon]